MDVALATWHHQNTSIWDPRAFWALNQEGPKRDTQMSPLCGMLIVSGAIGHLSTLSDSPNQPLTVQRLGSTHASSGVRSGGGPKYPSVRRGQAEPKRRINHMFRHKRLQNLPVYQKHSARLVGWGRMLDQASCSMFVPNTNREPEVSILGVDDFHRQSQRYVTGFPLG